MRVLPVTRCGRSGSENSRLFFSFSIASLWLLLLFVGGVVPTGVDAVAGTIAPRRTAKEVEDVMDARRRLFEHLHDRTILDYHHELLGGDDRRGRQLETTAAATTTAGVAAPADDDDDPMTSICRAVQDSFAPQHEVDCRCMGNVRNGGSFSMSCDYGKELCHESAAAGLTCGRPQIAVSMVDGHIFSSTTCISQYRRGMLPMDDTCVFVDACPHDFRDESRRGVQEEEDGAGGAFCGCTASYGGQVCGRCEVCPNGRSITVDCSNVNVEAVTKQCQELDTDLHLAAGAGQLAGFAPSFSGFCTQLEKAVNDTIACDCTNAVGGTFGVTCKTTEPVCVNDERHCGMVKSTVNVVDGRMDQVVSCGTYTSEPFSGGETCTGIQLCSSSDAATTTAACGCWATYNGQKCNSCEVCGDDDGGNGLTLDCSNVHENAVVEQCQPLNLTTSYEFLPDYPIAARESIVFSGESSSSNQKKNGQSGAVAARPGWWAPTGLVGAAAFLLSFATPSL
jgi:hypothetical protein